MAQLISSLGISLPTLIAQVINFLILFGALYIFAYKPIMKMFDERARKVKESLDQAEQIKEQAARADEEVRKRIEAAAKDGQEIITRAEKTGLEARQKAQEEARQEADNIIARAQAEIRRERDEAVIKLRKEFADLTVLVAGKVIDQTLDKKAHEALIDKMLEESEPLGKG